MADEPASEVQLLRKHKAQLIDILSADADFVLQHADSRCLLSSHGYQQVKACRIPSEKVTELLDHVIQRSPEAAQGFLQLLKEQSLQETFPLLDFVKDLQVTTLSSDGGLFNRCGLRKGDHLCRTEDMDSDRVPLSDLSESLIDHSEGQRFLNETVKIIVEEVLQKGTDVKEKVCEWKAPEELALLLDLELRSTGEPEERLLQRVKDVAKYSVKTCHPHFFNQQFAGVDYHSLSGRFLSEALNTNLFTYEVAPVFILMESEVLRAMRRLVGWTEGDGLFCPGGSSSNMYAMNLARHRHFPDVKTRGLFGLPRLAVFTSPESHYSVKKGAAFLGIGTDNVVLVKVDEGGRMVPSDLNEKIMLTKSQGAVPFLVSCTSGTTVQGAFDPLDQIADICEKHKIWMHIDAAWGGSVLFSKQHRHLMKGVDRADSVAWNPHKMLSAGLQCSVLLLKDTSNLLKQCHSASATYLFQQDKFYDINLDVGDKSVQCSRKVDCLKLWLMWKAVGSEGLERRVDKAFLHVRYLVEQMKKRDGFTLLREPEFVNVCFWYIPPSLRGKEGNTDYQKKLAQVAPTIKERMMKQGTMMLGYQPLGNRVNFFRVVVLSPLVCQKDMDWFLDEIERLGKDL